MSLKFGWYKTPVPEGRENKKLPHARVIPQGTLNTKRMCKIISDNSTLSSADVKGVLEALNFWMGFYLAEGNSIELEGLGYFSPTLKSHQTVDEKGRNKVIAQADTVGFRCATSLKEAVREAGLEMVKQQKKTLPDTDERKMNILAHVNKNVSINCSTAMAINNSNRYLALNDLKELVEEEKLIRTGGSRQTVYIWPYK